VLFWDETVARAFDTLISPHLGGFTFFGKKYEYPGVGWGREWA